MHGVRRILKVYSTAIEKSQKGDFPKRSRTRPCTYVLNSMSRRDSICYRFKFSARALINGPRISRNIKDTQNGPLSAAARGLRVSFLCIRIKDAEFI